MQKKRKEKRKPKLVSVILEYGTPGDLNNFFLEFNVENKVSSKGATTHHK